MIYRWKVIHVVNSNTRVMVSRHKNRKNAKKKINWFVTKQGIPKERLLPVLAANSG